MIFGAPDPPLAIPTIPLTPWLLARAVERGDKPAFIDGQSGRTLTYAGWSRSVRAAAAGLASHGFRKGDVVAICSPNLLEYPIAFHAVSLLGGATTTISPLCTAGELTTQVKDAGAKYIISIPPFIEKAAEASRAAGVRELFMFGDAEGAIPFASLSATHAEPPAVTIDPREDLVALPYSSGTGGPPKGVMLTHYNLVANTLQAASALGVEKSDTLLGLLPFFHIYGLGIINVTLHQGATVVLMPRFDVEQCVETIRRYSITYAPVVPPIVMALASNPTEHSYNLPSLRVVFSGAAPLDERIAAVASARLSCPVVQGYGLTETSPVTHATRLGPGRVIVAGVGPPVPNTEVRIVDVQTGSECEPNEQGEICVRGPQVMKGYLNRDDATASTIDDERWLRTGDLGYANEEGCLFIVDRLKELIKYKGLQVAPAELEALLIGHPAVADAAVVPRRNEEAGEVPIAFVVLKGSATADEIGVYVAARVSPHKRLHSIEFVDQIPRSPAGKILRRLLVQRDT